MTERPISADPMIFQNLRVAAALALEIKRTKRGVLKDYVAWLTEWFADNDLPYEPNPSVKRALEK